MTRTELPARIGPYEILDVVAAGSLGSVYKARHATKRQLVALRVLAPGRHAEADALERFLRGARAMGQLTHPNIVKVVDQDLEGEVRFVATAFVEGASLAERLKASRLTPGEALFVVGEVAKALTYAHGLGVIHGDLSPRSVLVSSDLSSVRVTDFGIGRPEATVSAAEGATTSRFAMASVSYLAPELGTETGQIDHRVDIYALGVLCYEALTGKLPLGRFSLPSDLNHEVPTALDPIILKCLARNPAERYQRADAFLTDLVKVEESMGYHLARELKRLSPSKLLGGAPKVSEPGAAGSGSNLVPIAAAAVLLVVLGAAGVWWWQSRAATPEPTTEAKVAPAAAQPPAEARAQAPPTPPPSASAAQTSGKAPISAQGGSGPAAQPTPAQAPAAAGAGAQAAAPGPAAGTSTSDASRLDAARRELASIQAGAAARPATEVIAALKGWLSQYGTTAAAPDALLLCGRLQADRGLKQDAIETYHEIDSRFPADPHAADALLAQAQLMVQLKARPEEIRERLSRIATDYYATAAFVPAMSVKIALEDREKLRETDPELGIEVPASIATRRELIAHGPTGPVVESTMVQLAEKYADLKQWGRAAQAWVDLARRFPGSSADPWFAAGELYERRLSDPAKAREAYLRVQPASSHYKDAQSRARRLEKRQP